ncbi:MAG: DUF2090 domain-containing protein [bacterium]
MLFILPFDHRSSFCKLLGFEYPVNKKQAKVVARMKNIVFDAFLEARKQVDRPDEHAILVDEEFGSAILKKARRQKIRFAQTVEKSGQKVFDFDYGADFGKRLLKFKPEFAKALVRYNPNQHAVNKTQNAKLKKLSRFCRQNHIKLMLEVLVEGKGDRSALVTRSIKQIQKAGVDPAIWKIEGLEKVSDWRAVRRETDDPAIVLGRGESRHEVEKWIKTAAKSGDATGFAIGRTIFAKPIADYAAHKIDRETAVEKISNNYLHFINLWERLV